MRLNRLKLLMSKAELFYIIDLASSLKLRRESYNGYYGKLSTKPLITISFELVSLRVIKFL